MVMKILNKIKHELPGLLDYVMFYNTGIVFQSTFSNNIDVPAISANLLEIISMFKKSLEYSKVTTKDYLKIIFETKERIIIILKLGEDSNIALFFDNEVVNDVSDVNIGSVQKYLNKLEKLIDMNESEISQINEQ
jgi:predicted regulator of Ras-like GTPase activity (Roadblock/LC7/MglB family)